MGGLFFEHPLSAANLLIKGEFLEPVLTTGCYLRISLMTSESIQFRRGGRAMEQDWFN